MDNKSFFYHCRARRPASFLMAVCLPLLLTVVPVRLFPQDSNVSLNGYVKELYMLYSPATSASLPGGDNLMMNTIHNRLNFKWYANDNLTMTIEMRNRLMCGNMVKNFPGYRQALDADNGLADLSWVVAKGTGWFLHTMIDRAYMDYSIGKWQISAGRQRVNWGVNLVWNPNDIFNTFSYFDFDYEERPGTDAVRVQYYTGATSSAELVYKPGHDTISQSLAARYRFSLWDYDFQFIGGQAGKDWAIGGGWSGDIFGAGFRGEITRFEPREPDRSSATVASVSADYTFKNSLYIHSGFLYNSDGKIGNAGGMNILFNPEMSARQLSFARYSLFGEISKPVTPLFTVDLSGIVNPSDGSFYFGPTLTYSLMNNLELMFTGQLFFGDTGTEFGDVGQVFFGRLRWSF